VKKPIAEHNFLKYQFHNPEPPFLYFDKIKHWKKLATDLLLQDNIASLPNMQVISLPPVTACLVVSGFWSECVGVPVTA
jgi:hypothetical protein